MRRATFNQKYNELVAAARITTTGRNPLVSPLLLSHVGATANRRVWSPAACVQSTVDNYPILEYHRGTYNRPRPCGDFPWPDAAVEAVNCDYDYSDYYGYFKGRCNVKCSDEDILLVGPQSGYAWTNHAGDYFCRVSNMTWSGEEPQCLGQYNNSMLITDESNRTRLVGGEFYGCVELYDDITRQWGPVRGWRASARDRMSWADLACRNLGFREGLATAGFRLTNGVVSDREIYYLQSSYRPSYPSHVPKFVVSQSLPQGEGATLYDAIDRVVRGPCPSNDYDCSTDSRTMCLACAGEREDDDSHDIAAHVTCTSDHLEASFPRPADSSVQPADVQLAAPPCRAEANSTHIYIRTPLGECGTSRESTPGEMIYRNTLIIGADSSHGGITWQPVTKVPLECRLQRNKTLSLDFRPHLKSVFRSGVQGRGDFRISMELFRTDGFLQPVTEYPVFVELREMLHVQIQVNSSDPDLQVFAHTCVATPSDDPDDKVQNEVIVDGCAKLPTLQFYPSPGPDRGRFGFQAFAYTSGVDMVYLHCDVLLCKASDPDSRCAQGCQPPSGRRRREAEGEPEVYRLTQGPIVVGEDQNGEAGGTTPARGYLVTASAVAGACAVLAAAMSVAGVLYTARRHGGPAGYRALEARGQAGYRALEARGQAGYRALVARS
ncbi:CUZD1 [Branchiostoma lanceolatum]|uniref:CUZD1 protein n=1 Tax=Branchiostoma lanceolatum TaxID=7740 RepID=A0A8J9ZSS8_BRALA|nr:CUZD1 [Branchiostoma lanceolatum]